MLTSVGSNIVWFAGVVGAVSSLIAAGYKLKGIWIEHKRQKEFENYTRMWTLRLAIVNAEFPIDERIEAGKKYIDHGGNGYVKHYVQALEEAQDIEAHRRAEGTI